MRVIVIGSGAGGLTAAAYLAQAGWQVTVLEQAAQFGGFLNPFSRKKYHFDPGVHYIGECRPGQSVYQILEGLGLSADELLCEMDPNGFDVFRFPDFEVRMCRGVEAFRDRLVELFPKEKQGLDRFFKTAREIRQGVDQASSLMSGKAGILSPLKLLKYPSLLRWFKATYAEFLQWTFDDPHLRSVMAASCGDYGLPPSKASAMYGIMVLMHYADGAFFPRGGTGRLRDALVKHAKNNGATFKRNAEVAKIFVEKGKVTGVETADGEKYEADAVVSAIEPALTFGRLIDGDQVPVKLREKISRLKPSLGTFCVFLGMKRNLHEHGLGAFNVWDYPGWDIDELYRPVFDGMLPDKLPFFLSPNSLKDDSGQMAPPGCSTLEIVTCGPYEMFAKWDGMRAYQRGEEYERLKGEIADRLLEEVAERHPGLIGDIEVKEIATPVTNSFYVNSIRGGAYGPAAIPGQVGPMRFQTKTPFEGLYLAGSGVYGGGVSPCLMSGRAAAGAVAGKRF